MGFKLKNVMYRMRESCLRCFDSECISVIAGILLSGCTTTLRMLGPLCILFGCLMITVVVYTYATFIFPSYLQREHGWFIFNPHFWISCFFVAHIYFNYILCAFTSPGSPAPCNRDASAIFGKKVTVVDGKRYTEVNYRLDICPTVSYRYCKECKCVKPPRSRHCSISRKCILNFDHYCPWMNNAIGYHNYRYFVCFLFHTFIGSVYAVNVMLPLLQNNGTKISLLNRTASMQTIFGFELSVEFLMFISFVVAVAATFSVGFLLVWHIYLILTNQTTIEFYIHLEESSYSKSQGLTFKNPHDLGYRKNIRRVFGDVPWFMSLLMSVRVPPPPEFPFEIADYVGYNSPIAYHV